MILRITTTLLLRTSEHRFQEVQVVTMRNDTLARPSQDQERKKYGMALGSLVPGCCD